MSANPPRRPAHRSVLHSVLRPVLNIVQRHWPLLLIGCLMALAFTQSPLPSLRGSSLATTTATTATSHTTAAAEPVPDFALDIVPLLSRHGCNAGGCHGKASGQNGFKLSLFGYDPIFDYEAIVNQARGRRLFAAAPEHSLLLAKASGQVPHGGGRRWEPDGADYQTVRAWIVAGAKPARPDAPKLVRLELIPNEKVFQPGQTQPGQTQPGQTQPGQTQPGQTQPGQTQPLTATAIYSDGSRRDVTARTQFSSNLDVVAAVDDAGVVRPGKERGEAAIMARFMGQVAVFRAILPHGKPLAEIPNFQPANYVDRLAADKWRKLGLLPSPRCDDATYLRRVTIDLCGRLPTVDEARQFLTDQNPNKRSALVERLLESPDYPAFFALRWGAILRNSNLAGADQAAYAFHNWIKEMLARNRPYDEFVRGIVAASGEWQDAPAINWYWQSRDDQLHQVTADTAQVFLGIRLQCARCHHHPYERWGQDDYFGLAGFFTRLGRKGFGQPPPYYASATPTTGERHPLTGKTPEPKYLDGDLAQFTADEDPRHGLVDWMARPENPFFASVLVNRLWGHFLGRGLVHEVDDLRATNPPTNPELLAALSQDFIAHKFDMKHLIRTIVNSQVYQLSSEPQAGNEHDRQNFARFYARRMLAEVFLDAVDQATDMKTRFNGVSSQARAVDLPHEGFGSYFLDTFDRPRRVTSCECERSTGATLAQVLLLKNSDEIENKLSAGEGRIARLTKAKSPPDQLVQELYLATLSRFPTASELKTTMTYLETETDRTKATEDLLWTLLNTKEFMFNH